MMCDRTIPRTGSTSIHYLDHRSSPLFLLAQIDPHLSMAGHSRIFKSRRQSDRDVLYHYHL